MEMNKEYKSFLYSYHFANGLRITAGIALPAIILSYVSLLQAGIFASLGALCISITDNPGPIHHRRNGMLISMLINSLVTIITGFSLDNPVWLGIFILIACFVFSMAGVYGARANAIGVSALIILIINLNHHEEATQVLYNALWILAGSAWYMLLSLAIHVFRPYRLTQQALGDLIITTADYLRTRAEFYQKEVNYTETYGRMMALQSVLLQKQNLVRELLFKGRKISRESTIESKTLLLIYLDVTELFERLSASFQDYETLHHYFPEEIIFEKFRSTILSLANEMEEIGLAVLSGTTTEEKDQLPAAVTETASFLEAYSKQYRTTENEQGFHSFELILQSIKDIQARLHTLHLYTKYDKSSSRQFRLRKEFDQAVPRQHYNLDILRNSLTLRSNIFRHALRVSIATGIGYCISFFFPFGHSYWILLTIIVILKPAYSLSRKRNVDRLAGTIAGVFLGILILYFVKNKTALFIIMLFLMTGTYSLLRTKYMWSVLLMTPYILVVFHLLNLKDFQSVMMDRVIDTAIGSIIAFAANLLLFPYWSHNFIKKYLLQFLEKSQLYFEQSARFLWQQDLAETTFQRSRKEAFTALANLSDAFTQMLTEPKRKRLHVNQYQEMVVLAHMLSSHIATLAYFSRSIPEGFTIPDFQEKITPINAQFKTSIHCLSNAAQASNLHTIPAINTTPPKEKVQHLSNQSASQSTAGLLKPISEQFDLIKNITTDMVKICRQIA